MSDPETHRCANAQLDRKLPDLPNWTIHDLRRTARSLLSRVVTPHIAERVLGHVIGGVAGTYDRHSYSLACSLASFRIIAG